MSAVLQADHITASGGGTHGGNENPEEGADEKTSREQKHYAPPPS
jgi:hypothetical protein